MAVRSETFDLASGDPRGRLVEELRRQVGGWEAAAQLDENVFSTGIEALDRLLIASPLRYGMLIEWLSGMARCGAATLSLLCAREACRAGGMLVVIDRLQTFYPPAAAAWGIDLSRLIIVRPGSVRDELWAAVQALRSPAVAAVWAPIERLDGRAFRRLQLAAQSGRTLGLLLRPGHVRDEPSWADVRLWVRSRVESRESRARTPALDTQSSTLDSTRRVVICLLRARAGRPGGSITLEIDDAARMVREASQLSAIGYRPARTDDRRKPTADSRKSSHDTLPLHLVSELADSTAASLPARAQ